jgi:hypothetical protein
MNGRLAYPVRDELLAKAGVLASHGIDEGQIREAAAWAGVAVLKRLHRLLEECGTDPARIRPLVASLRIYEGEGYRALPSALPARILEILRHSELFKQAYWVADRYWMPEEDARFCPAHALTLEDETGVLEWAPVQHTLGQFIEHYDALIKRVRARM